ncbi:DUF6249 domain-containing protein [Porphyrobacter sp. ULC335]|uniref:DUF6249 domain-containing protein n=1 Tax=Porphyrobacter sp. ULC335 TaxID=2854260 RepID=UPI00221FA794|nr:DUF6249 domain-containing protein [Porphyrobacter sp. ULC335]UYV15464.1 hypothetical protein KVF90_15365 [Porphyrobacter sp. ULC335]
MDPSAEAFAGSFIPLIVMLTPVAIILIFLRYRKAVVMERYRTLLALVDKGVDLPAGLLSEAQAPDADRRRAFVLIGGGLGVMAMFVALPFEMHDGARVSSLWGIGLLPLMTGLGYFASWWFNRRDDMRG